MRSCPNIDIYPHFRLGGHKATSVHIINFRGNTGSKSSEKTMILLSFVNSLQSKQDKSTVGCTEDIQRT